MSEDLDGCVPARPGDGGCGEVREVYGMCPDHDGWCAPDCPIGDPTAPGNQEEE